MPASRQTRWGAERFPLQVALDRFAADMDISDIAAQLGVSTRQVYRWKRNGLHWAAADRVAITFGSHPLLVWPAWGQAVPEEEA